ncbi:MAG: bacterial Ig-like domain-containing protein [Clostridia bacterium]|nr:bacterial Ig-like domain-containing protein [Clostridia bacterium]
MNKIMRFSAMLAFVLGFCGILVGCGKKIDKIEVDLTSIKTEYYVGDTVESFDNVKVYVVYEDETKEQIEIDDKDLDFSNISTQTAGKKTLTVTYKGEYTFNVEINVTALAVTGIEVDETTIQKEYYVGETVTFAGTKITATYNNGSTAIIPVADVEFSAISTAEAGTQTLTVTYNGKTDTVEILIKEGYLTGIEVDATDMKTEYYVGETVSIAGAKITAIYNNGTKTLQTSEVQVSPVSTETAGTKTVTISYGAFSDDVEILVKEKVLESIAVTPATVKTEYIKGEVADHSGVEIKATYEGDFVETVNVSDAVFTGLDLTKSGYQTLTISFGGKSVDFDVTVYSTATDKIAPDDFEKPNFVNTYNTNIAAGTTKFVDNTQKYAVGTDNAFKFLPEMRIYDAQLNATTITSYKSKVKVWEKLGEANYSELTGGNLTKYVAVNDETSEFDFTEEAIGKVFKISVEPFFHEGYEPITFEFVVEQGYNVYTADELCVFDNVNGSGIWADFKAEKGLSNVNATGIILHADLALTAANIADGHLYKAGDLDRPATADYNDAYKADTENNPEGKDLSTVDSLRDYAFVYERKVAHTDTFNFNANYFTIDGSKIPLITNFEGDNDIDKITHSSLFRFLGDEENYLKAVDEENKKAEGERQEVSKGVATMKNLYVSGNAHRTEKVWLAGGIILVKVADQGLVVNFENNVTIKCGITYFSEHEAETNMKNCIANDNFSSILYSFGQTKNTITNCSFTKCGGPISIVAHASPDKNPDAYGVYTIDSESKLENWVSGQEGWFNILNAGGLVNGLKPLSSALYDGSKKLADYDLIEKAKGFTKTEEIDGQEVELINAISVVMNGSGPLETVDGKIKGKFEMTGSTINMLDDELYNFYLENCTNGAAPIMQSGGITTFTDGTDMYHSHKAEQGYGLPYVLDGYDGENPSQAELATLVQFYSGSYVGISTPLVGGACYTGVLLGYC